MTADKKSGSIFSSLIRIILPICIILAGLAGWNYLKSKEAKVKRRPPQKQAVAVETITMKPGSHQSFVQVMGTVVPDSQIVLKSRVAGEVMSISPAFVQGGYMKKGETLLTIDDADYKIEVQKVQSALDKALSDLAIEKGSQLIAKEELKLINEASIDEIKATDLSLRKPQLVKANAIVKSARADIQKAKLNLSRTRITVPFNAIVLEKHVDPGSLLNVQGTIAALVGVDAYRVEAFVPPDRLTAIRISETDGSQAFVDSRYSKQTWKGRVVRTTGRVTDKSRMAGVIILINDPLGLSRKDGNSQLLLGDHVDVKILGETFENVFSLPRAFLRDGDTVWVYNSGKLEIKAVTLAWKADGQVFIKSGIREGDKIITSDLPAPVKGMALQSVSGEAS
jgi:RND family efflux transporter MFP subunit